MLQNSGRSIFLCGWQQCGRHIDVRRKPTNRQSAKQAFIDEREVLAEREPMLEAGALRDIQAEGRRLCQDRVDGIVLIGRIGQFWKSF
jgi:hypothetical protein